MGYGSLFERLAGESAKRSSLSVDQAIVASIAAHLAKMLSTRAGSVQALPDYGLPDLNDMRLSLHDSLQQARLAIEAFIDAYEPRLSQVRVVALPHEHDPLCLSFALQGRLDVAGQRRTVSFTARLNGSGQVQVQ